MKREFSEQAAEAKLYTDTKSAEGLLYKQRQDAEANYNRVAKEAEAKLYSERQATQAVTIKAEASFFAKKIEAEAMVEMAKEYGQMSEILGRPQGLLQYMILQNNTHEKLANANALTIKGLQKKL